MSLWVLDTDTLTIWLRGQETIAARIAATPPQQLAVTIITVEEVLGGWYTQIRRHAMINSLHGPIGRSNKLKGGHG
jgi:tRNA(fMet)-specific endonuclease VapC